MARDEWFRSGDWNAEIEKQFYLKLGRATKHNRPQYTCIQAHHLSKSHPCIALRLLDEYFTFDKRSDDARAYTFRADAYLSLGNIEQATEAYEAAIAKETESPNAITDARIELPFLIASSRIRSKYDRALTLLADPGTLLFPLQMFKHHASLALILSELDEPRRASSHACAALRVSTVQHSGLRYYPHLGLVAGAHNDIRAELSRIATDCE